jgi:hypothetical protein
MIIDLVDKLISRLIELIKERKSLRKERFDDIVIPIFTEFEQVHQDYITTFRMYREMLNKSENTLGYVISQIQMERLFGEQKRSKLRAIVFTTANSRCDELLREFCNAIYRYLTFAHSDDWLALDDPNFPEGIRPSRNSGMQRWYRQYIVMLKYLAVPITERKKITSWGYWLPIPMLAALERILPIINATEDPRNLAVDLLDMLVESMQDEYERVANIYASLMNELNS